MRIFIIVLLITCNAFSQTHQNKLKFSYKAIGNKNYHVYVENPTAQLHSFKVVLKGENFKIEENSIKIDTISAETKRIIFRLKKKKKKAPIIIDYTWVEAIGSVHVQKTLGHKYQLPYPRGKKHKVIQGYNGSFSHKNQMALDFAMPKGTAVHAMRSGQIFSIKMDGNHACPEKECLDLSNYIKILHYDGTVAVYKNLLPNGTSKKVGDFVNAGQRIARSGFTGQAKTPNLHVEVQILNSDISGYTSKPFEFILSPLGKSKVLDLNDEYIRY